jgi:hypothetical protein
MSPASASPSRYAFGGLEARTSLNRLSLKHEWSNAGGVATSGVNTWGKPFIGLSIHTMSYSRAGCLHRQRPHRRLASGAPGHGR